MSSRAHAPQNSRAHDIPSPRADELPNARAMERSYTSRHRAPRASTRVILAVIAALALGAANTFGDLLWAGLSLRHRMVTGIAHGALLCLFIGAFVGWHARRPAAGAAAGPVIGVIAAASFYLLAPAIGYWAMFPAWMLFWICFGVLLKALGGERTWSAALLRGLVAALISGLAFYAISGIWTRPPRGGPNYWYNFGAWSFAFLPGFLALFFRTSAGALEQRRTATDAREFRTKTE
jgi:hypothetical protein